MKKTVLVLFFFFGAASLHAQSNQLLIDNSLMEIVYQFKLNALQKDVCTRLVKEADDIASGVGLELKMNEDLTPQEKEKMQKSLTDARAFDTFIGVVADAGRKEMPQDHFDIGLKRTGSVSEEVPSKLECLKLYKVTNAKYNSFIVKNITDKTLNAHVYFVSAGKEHHVKIAKLHPGHYTFLENNRKDLSIDKIEITKEECEKQK